MIGEVAQASGFPRQDAGGRRLLGVPFWQLTTVEALLGVVLVSLASRQRLVIAGAMALAVLGLVAVLGRRARRSLLAWVAVSAGYLTRRRQARVAPQGADSRLAPLLEVLPQLRVDEVELRSGQRLAVCFDGTGWSAMVSLGDDSLLDNRPDPPQSLPLSLLTEVLQVDDIPLAAVQLLVHTVPAPYAWQPDGASSAQSYQQLSGRLVPVVRRTYVVLRLDAVSGAAAVQARGGGTPGAGRALKRSTNRLLDLLAKAGVPARPVTLAAWPAAVAELAGTGRGATGGAAGLQASLGVAGPGHGGRRTGETRHAWQVDDHTQVTWWVHRWPDDVPPLQALVDLAEQVPTSTAQVSLAVYPAPPAAPAGSARCRSLIRVGDASAEVVEAAAAALVEQAKVAQLGLHRLDGEQGPAYLATLPFGGGSW